MKNDGNPLVRYAVSINGIVQGVGFRPYIYNRAVEFGVKGFVKNAGSGVVIDAEAPRQALKSFIKEMVQAPPPLSQIEKISIRRQEVQNFNDFKILESQESDQILSFIPKDTAVCEKCLKDISDESSRWFGYAFTNCTDCGPRYSILKKLPYDRCNTSMDSFVMCEACSAEYNEPSSRRFHAQPVCCPECGPQLQLLNNLKQELRGTAVIKKAVQLLKAGCILAVKGIGGFHLMCDAQNAQAIEALRSRKRRPDKPLAVMAKDMAAVEKLCEVDDAEAKLLQSPASPIVLMNRKHDCPLPKQIAPDSSKLGIMLPYTPLHHLLFKEGMNWLVATSGNKSGLPIEYQNDEALKHLSDTADYFLLHNRDINIPIDDSVFKVFRGQKQVSRAARGYSPLSFNMGAVHQLVALGAEQKASVCLSKGGYAYMSQYMGDIKNPKAYQTYKKVIDNLIMLTKTSPCAYVHDLHPDYLSTRYAMEQSMRKIGVQHHFAHMSACMAENRLSGMAIGVIYDGTGIGIDGKVWGGEFLVGNLEGFERAGQLSYMKLQGGDKAVEQPWRTAVSYMSQAGIKDWGIFKNINEYALETVQEALEAGLNCHETSSMGRLFDCVSAMLGLSHSISYDAQAAIMLENIADYGINGSYDYDIYYTGKCLQIDFRRLLEGILRDIRKGRKAGEIAGLFHNTAASFTAEAVEAISRQYGIRNVVLSGGCFENSLLLGLILDRLECKDFQVYFHKLVPCNDGGVSFGQLAAADSMLRR
ncbi:MAG: carbamoyltransferase HypF [Clostridia bacterium]|nr:carbamoyltransferase HypF [Clostridia bacterium]